MTSKVRGMTTRIRGPNDGHASKNGPRKKEVLENDYKGLRVDEDSIMSDL